MSIKKQRRTGAGSPRMHTVQAGFPSFPKITSTQTMITMSQAQVVGKICGAGKSFISTMMNETAPINDDR